MRVGSRRRRGGIDKRKVGRRMCVNERETSVTVELQGAEVVKVDKFKSKATDSAYER